MLLPWRKRYSALLIKLKSDSLSIFHPKNVISFILFFKLIATLKRTPFFVLISLFPSFTHSVVTLLVVTNIVIGT